MNKTIHIREAVTPEEVERFWQELHAYHARDIFPEIILQNWIQGIGKIKKYALAV